jgi:hypothetical protein
LAKLGEIMLSFPKLSMSFDKWLLMSRGKEGMEREKERKERREGKKEETK